MTKILVIEDEKSLLNEVSDILTFEGYEVAQAINGFIGEQLTLSFQPDLILCDIMMPEMTGTELLTRLRSNKLTNRIPFIFMSALAERKHLRHGMDLGADDYISKPFTLQELLNAVRTRLNKRDVLINHYQAKLEKVKEEMNDRVRKLVLSIEDNTIHPDNLVHKNEKPDGSFIEALRSIDTNNKLANLEKLINRELQGDAIGTETEMSLIKLRNEIRKKSNLLDNWSIFQLRFNQVHPGFTDRLLSLNKTLTNQDLTLASAIYIDLNTQQLAGLFNITAESVRKNKYRLKLKLKLKEEEQLHGFLNTL